MPKPPLRAKTAHDPDPPPPRRVALDPVVSQPGADLEALFHTHYAGLCDFVLRYVQSREIAEEVVQDLFLRLWEMSSDSASVELSKSYLYSAAKNRAIRHLRHQRVVRRWEEQAVTEADIASETVRPTGADAVLAADLGTAAEQAIARLPERCRLIFLMSRREGMSYAEIAQALEISVSTVETQMWRALRSLRASLAPYL